MATNLGELIYTLTLNDSGFQGQLNTASNQVKEAGGQMGTTAEETQAKTGALGGAFSSMAGQFVVGAAVFTAGQKALGAIKGAISGAIQASKDWQTQQAGLQAELKSTHDASGMSAKGITELAEGIQKTTPISREAALTGDNMLLTFTNLHKNVFPAASQAVADMATRMNGGLVPSSQQMNQTALQLGKALNDPAQGLMMLRRVGVTFSEQQKEQIKTMEKAGDTAGAQKVMLEELHKEFGGSAAANMKTYTGQWDALKNRFHDIAGQAIQKLIQMLEKVGQFLISHKAILMAVIGAVGGLAIAIGVALVSALWAMVAPAVAAVIALWPIVAVGAAIGAIAYEVITHWKDLKQWFDDFIKFIKDIFNDGLEFIKKHWALIVDIILGPLGVVITTVIQHWATIKAGFADALNFVKGIWSGIVGFFEGLWHGITGTVGQIGKVLGDAFKIAFNAIIGLWDDTMGKLFHGQKVGVGPIHFELPNLYIPKMAQGGIVDSATLALIGEAGPEAVVPLDKKNTAGIGGATYNFMQGSVILSTKDAVDEFFSIGNRNTQLELAGGSPLAGTAGV